MNPKDLLKRGYLVGVLLWLGVAFAVAHGQPAGVQFEAEMVQRSPDGSQMSGRMFVGDGQVRIETVRQGQRLVRITDEARGVEWVLFPDQRRYLESSPPPDRSAVTPPTGHDQSPCAGMPGLTCRELGQDRIEGRPVTKWEVTGTQEGRVVTTIHWIDTERGIPLIQELPDGQRVALRFVGHERLDGRAVEKWETIMTAPNRPAMRTFQWYDPELQLATKQELPGGVINELRSIRVGEQAAELFAVPADYSRASGPEDLSPPRR